MTDFADAGKTNPNKANFKRANLTDSLETDRSRSKATFLAAAASVVWESQLMAALHGDESRLPVFDLDGDGVYSVLHATKGGTWSISAKTGKTEWSPKEAVGDINTLETAPYQSFTGDKSNAYWMVNENFAQKWKLFVTTGKIFDKTPPFDVVIEKVGCTAHCECTNAIC